MENEFFALKIKKMLRSVIRKKSLTLILTTVPSRAVGRKLADVLLKEKLAACVAILPGVESHYVWKGKREKSAECQLLIKTVKSRFKQVVAAIRQNHPYECPEILQVPVIGEWAPYGEWIRSSCRS